MRPSYVTGPPLFSAFRNRFTFMFIYSKFQNRRSLAGMLAIGGCVFQPPPLPAENPADPGAPAATTAPFQPRLLANSRSFLSPTTENRENRLTPEPHQLSPRAAIIYTCPMQPEIQETKPGNCPICGMTLVRKTSMPKGARP